MKIENRTKRAMGFNGIIVDIRRIKNANIILGENFAHNTFYSLDLGNLSNAIKQKTDYSISGIIGADILIKYHCIIDYNQRQLTFVSKQLNHQLALTK